MIDGVSWNFPHVLYNFGILGVCAGLLSFEGCSDASDSEEAVQVGR